jgi:hypothetical protein
MTLGRTLARVRGKPFRLFPRPGHDATVRSVTRDWPPSRRAIAFREVGSLVHQPCIGSREIADAPGVPPGHRPARLGCAPPSADQ